MKITILRNTLFAVLTAVAVMSCGKDKSGKSSTQSGLDNLANETIDLGLSVKWRNRNLGAEFPTSAGAYYQWAGLADVTSTSISLVISNCPYHTGAEIQSGWLKYVSTEKCSYWSGTGNPDNKTVLDANDDAAHVKLGGSWRIPTYKEWKELQDKCTWTWIKLGGVAGMKIQSNVRGYENKWIFLPAAGFRFMNVLSDVGNCGDYWSSTLDISFPAGAYSLEITSRNIFLTGGSRYFGAMVRPVTE